MRATLGFSDIAVRIIGGKVGVRRHAAARQVLILRILPAQRSKDLPVICWKSSNLSFNPGHFQATRIGGQELPIWRGRGGLQVFEIRVEHGDIGPQSTIHPISAHA